MRQIFFLFGNTCSVYYSNNSKEYQQHTRQHCFNEPITIPNLYELCNPPKGSLMHMTTRKAVMRLHNCAVSPEHSLFKNTKYRCRRSLKETARDLCQINGQTILEYIQNRGIQYSPSLKAVAKMFVFPSTGPLNMLLQAHGTT